MRKILVVTLVVLALIGLWSGAVARPQKTASAGLKKGVLDVTVEDNAGNRLAGAVVSVPGYRSTTGLGGSCRFSLVPGRYAIMVSKDGYRGRRVSVGVRPEETVTAHVRLDKLPGAHARK